MHRPDHPSAYSDRPVLCQKARRCALCGGLFRKNPTAALDLEKLIYCFGCRCWLRRKAVGKHPARPAPSGTPWRGLYRHHLLYGHRRRHQLCGLRRRQRPRRRRQRHRICASPRTLAATWLLAASSSLEGRRPQNGVRGVPTVKEVANLTMAVWTWVFRAGKLRTSVSIA